MGRSGRSVTVQGSRGEGATAPHGQHDGIADVVARVLATDDTDLRLARLRAHPPSEALADALADEAVRLLRVDLSMAERAAEAVAELAALLRGKYPGVAARIQGHVAFQRGRPHDALRHYAQAAKAFGRLGLDQERARVRLAAFNALSRTGQLGMALAWAKDARGVFAASGDRLRSARVDANVATLLFRQDRVAESLRLGRMALRAFQRLDAPEDVAITQLNTAVRLTMANDFPRARRMFDRVRAYCAREGLHLLLAEAEGNLAYLFAQRGDYARALATYADVRARAAAAGQDYVVTWLLLDEAELLVELNAHPRAVPLAQEALERSQGRTTYDAAKALTVLAIAAARQGQPTDALDMFAQAHAAFLAEGSEARAALTGLYRAIVLQRLGQHAAAAQAAQQAREPLRRAGLGVKVALADLVMARAALAGSDLPDARSHLASARDQLRRFPSPALDYQAAFLLGDVAHAQSRRAEAVRAYRRAHRVLEALRSNVGVEELKVAFLEDKTVVYESMARAALEGHPTRDRVARSFAYVQQAKSRALAEMLARGPLPPTGHREPRLRRLRAELNACYREVSRLEGGADAPPPRLLASWRRRARATEHRLSRAMFEAARQDPRTASLGGDTAVSLEQVQRSLGGATLVEYFDVRGVLHAYVVDERRAAVVPLAHTEDVRRRVRLALFNIVGLPAPFRTPGRLRRMEEATEAHLRDLHQQLVGPLADWLDEGRPLVVAGHGPLHRFPFQALLGPRGFLGDAHPVSRTPSGTIFAMGRRRPARHGTGALVMGVADRQAPRIADEAHAVAKLCAPSTLLVGPRATEAALREIGPTCRIVHLAAHGLYRDENPMFSSIRLADSRLAVFDLADLRLNADLVTLSGCSTGATFVAGGDELLGLTRGLLNAGAACVHLSLWDVDDESTLHYVTEFYTQYLKGTTPSIAAQRAAAAIRRHYPHPYHWAPFVIVS